MRLQTKAQREELRAYDFDRLTGKGYTRETYKDLEIFTKDGENPAQYFATIYRGNAAHPMVNAYYRSADSRARAIEEYKKSAEYREERKKQPKQQTTAAKCAAAIREELKKNFPGVKFSVKSDNFSMGDSVDISWQDGPTEDMVTDFTAKYQYGHFDGMQDMYIDSNSREDIPQSKFVHTHRAQSEETKKALEAAALEFWPGDDWEETRERERRLWEVWRKSPLPLGAKVTGLTTTGKDCGAIEELYRVSYEGGQQPKSAADELPPTATEAAEVEPGTVQLVDYSEKAFAIIGDTYPIREKLEKAGGKFNKFLKCGPGWIFSKKRLDAVREAIQAKTEQQADELEAVREIQAEMIETSPREGVAAAALQAAERLEKLTSPPAKSAAARLRSLAEGHRQDMAKALPELARPCPGVFMTVTR